MSRTGWSKVGSDGSFCAFLETLVCRDWQAGAMSPGGKCLNSRGAYLLAGSPPGWSWLSQKQSPYQTLSFPLSPLYPVGFFILRGEGSDNQHQLGL